MQLPWVSLTEETLLPAGSLGVRMMVFLNTKRSSLDFQGHIIELQVYKNLSILLICVMCV